jgi:halimadienyl-diphosphate synthase
VACISVLRYVHAVIVGAGYVDRAVLIGSVEWFLSTQRKDGSWGYYNIATAEETAYALQALLIWKRNGGKVPRIALEKGISWLKENKEEPYPALWICKALYSPELIIRSTIYSALLLGEELL